MGLKGLKPGIRAVCCRKNTAGILSEPFFALPTTPLLSLGNIIEAVILNLFQENSGIDLPNRVNIGSWTGQRCLGGRSG